MFLFPKRIDIDAEAATILNNAARSVARILERRAELDKQNDPRPLMVFLGEQHSCPAHYLDTIATLHGLKQAAAPFAVAMERPHDTLTKLLPKLPLIEEKFLKLNRQAAQHISLHALSLFGGPWANYARTAKHDFMIENKIDSFFADASSNKGELNDADKRILNRDDPSTAQSIRETIGPDAENVSTTGGRGVYVRNDHMLRLSTEFAKRENMPIILFPCGNAHVAGWTGDEPFVESLAGIALKKDLPFVAIPRLCTVFDRTELRLDEIPGQDHFLVAEDLPRHEAIYNKEEKWSLATLTRQFNSTVRFGSEAKEKAYVEACLKRMNIAFDRPSLAVLSL